MQVKKNGIVGVFLLILQKYKRLFFIKHLTQTSFDKGKKCLEKVSGSEVCNSEVLCDF